MDNAFALISFIVYNAVLVAVGVWAVRKAKSQEDFLLGGRSLGPWVAGLAYAASSSSAWVLLGFSGFVYAAGPSALWMVPGILVGYGVIWLFSGDMLQRVSREKNHLTLTDFVVENAQGKLARIIRILSALIICFCYAYFIAAQFQGAGVAFADLFNMNLYTGVIFGAAIILIYTFLGGFFAVSITDTMQGVLMACVAIILPTVAFFAAGGLEGVSQGIAAAPDGYMDAFGGRTGWIAIGFVLGLSATGFGALGQPHLVSWIMATRDRTARLYGAGVAIGWGAVVYTGMGVLGLSARAIYGAEAPAEGVFFQLASDYLPALLGGLVAAATLSAIMSTVDSQFLVVGAAVSHDVGIGKLMGGREVLVSRLSILVLCVAAVGLTFFVPSTIFDRALFAWVAMGATFGPIIVARTLNFQFSAEIALAAVLVGFGTSLGFEFFWESGPGDVLGRVLPWIFGLIILSIAHFAKLGRPEEATGAKLN
ncbi:MAG: sodium/proline symporter [Pseudomonadota bacterium]